MVIDILEFLYICECTTINKCATDKCLNNSICELRLEHENMFAMFYSEGE